MTREDRILDGRALSKRIRLALRDEAAAFIDEQGFRPCLATVLVGEDPASAVYVRNKRRACERLGFESRHMPLPATTSQVELLTIVDELNNDPGVHGILVQLPLPDAIDGDAIIGAIDPRKDVDGFHPENVGLLALKKPRFVSCTPKGILRLLEEAGVDPKGRRATVVGRLNIVGLPVALLLLQAHATVRIVHSRTRAEDLEQAIREAEILVAAVGRPGFVPGDWVRPGAVVIDVGINRVPAEGVGKDGKPATRLVGDVDFEGAIEHAARITPVPGGVGPMTIAMLMENTLAAARLAAAADGQGGSDTAQGAR